MEDVANIIKSMKPKNSSGPENISSKLLKLNCDAIYPLLTHLINLSLTQGVFPRELKLAKVIPVYKADDSHIYGNYRPISLLPTLSKVYEKVVAKQLTAYLN